MKLSNYVSTNKWKLIKTIFCYLAFFSFGGCSTLLGSSLLDLQIRLGVSFKKLSTLVPSRSIGFFLGGVIAGFLDMCFGPDMVLFVSVFSSGVFTILAPWFKQFYGVYACLLLSGLAQGILEIYTNMCVLSTWSDKASNYGQILYGCFGLGALLSPLLVKPFLLPLVQNETETQSDEAILGDYTPDDVKVQYPYLVIGSILVFGSFGFLFFHFKNKSIKNENSSTDVEIVDAYYIAILSFIQVISVLSLSPICQKLFKSKTKTTLNRLASVRSSQR